MKASAKSVNVRIGRGPNTQETYPGHLPRLLRLSRQAKHKEQSAQTGDHKKPVGP